MNDTQGYPLLSVIIPAYNAEDFVAQCLESVIAQSYRNVQILVIDDGSKDSTPSICDSFAKSDSRIKVFHTENKGVSAARNLGLKHAKGEYVTFVDADDWLAPDTYRLNMALIQEHKAQIVQFPISRTDKPAPLCSARDELVKDKRRMFDLWIAHNKTITNYFCDKIFLKEIFSGLLFKEGVRFEDRLLFPDILERARVVYLSSSGLYFYRQHAQQYTKNTENGGDSFRFQYEADLHSLTLIPPDAIQSRVSLLLNMFGRYKELICQAPRSERNMIQHSIPGMREVWKNRYKITKLGGGDLYIDYKGFRNKNVFILT